MSADSSETGGKVAKKSRKHRGQKLIRMSALMLAGISLSTAMSVRPAPAQTFTCATGIAFGNFTTCASSQTATITPDNAQNVTGCLSAGAAPFNRGICTFTNFTASNFQFSVTKASFKVTNTAAASKTMVVDNFQCRFQGDLGTTLGACNYSKSPFFVTINIGADLKVAGSQAAGQYNGIFSVQTNIP